MRVVSAHLARAVIGVALLVLAAGPAHAELLRIIEDPLHEAGGEFGRALAAVGGDIAVGAPGARVFGQPHAGVVQLLGIDGVVRQTFRAQTSMAGAGLGTMLVANAGLLFASAPGDRPLGLGGVGAIYVFDPATRALVRIIRAPDPDASTFPVGGEPTRTGIPQSTGPLPEAGGFGLALAVVGDRLFVGAPRSTVDGLSDAGAVYIYDVGGALLRTLRDFPARAGARFGAAVAVVDGRLFVGVPGEPSLGAEGAGVVRALDAETGALLTTLRAGNPVEGAAFGTVVRDGGGELLVAAPGDRALGIDRAGAVYVFAAETAVLQRIVTPPTPRPSLAFGDAVLAVDGDLLVGADGAAVAGAEEAGRAFLFDGATFALQATFEPAFERAGGRFGFALEAVASTLTIGEPASDDMAEAGRVYVFTRDHASEPDVGQPPLRGQAGDRAPNPSLTVDCSKGASTESLDCRLSALLARATDEQLARPLLRALAGVRRAASARGQRRARALGRAVRAIARFERRLLAAAGGSADLEALLAEATAIDSDLRALGRASR